MITLSGILLGFVLAGSIPVERAFGVPGLGYAMFTAVAERDVFVMQNLVFLYAIVFVMSQYPGRCDDRLDRPEDPLPMTDDRSGQQPFRSMPAVRPVAAFAARRRIVARAVELSPGARRFRRSGAASRSRLSVMAIAAPLIAPYEPLKSDFRAMSKPPIEKPLVRHRPDRPRRLEPRHLRRPRLADGGDRGGAVRHDARRACGDWRAAISAGASTSSASASSSFCNPFPT